MTAIGQNALTAGLFVAASFGAMALSQPPLMADELAIDDLTEVDTSQWESDGWSVRAKKERMTLTCTSCNDFAAIDVLLAYERTGMDGRVRSGKATAERLFEICKDNAENNGTECYSLERADVDNAVGFLTSWKMNEDTYGATHNLFQGTRLVTVRSVAHTREEATKNAAAATGILQQIVK